MWVFIIFLAISEATKIYLVLKFNEESDKWTNKFIDLKRENDKLKALLELNAVKRIRF